MKKAFPGRVQIGNPEQQEGPELPVVLVLQVLLQVAANLWLVRFLRVFPRALGICASPVRVGLGDTEEDAFMKGLFE